jgi:hypothetical protein
MANIIDYIKISDAAKSINDYYTDPVTFSEKYWEVQESEKKSYLRFFTISNSPWAFKGIPILFEQLIQYLADKLQINPIEIKLIGSAKIGFSTKMPPQYGEIFNAKSDLDFSIVNENLFNIMQEEFNSWSKQFKLKQIMPHNRNEEFFWLDNLEVVPRQIKRGFIDSHKIPNRHEFKMTQNINNSLALIVVNLKETHSIEVKKASIFIFRDWTSFDHRLKQHTESILKRLKLHNECKPLLVEASAAPRDAEHPA